MSAVSSDQRREPSAHPLHSIQSVMGRIGRSVVKIMTYELPVGLFIIAVVAFGGLAVYGALNARQLVTQNDSLTATLRQQQIAAAYVPTIAQCKAYSPNADGAASVTISVASAGSHLCEASMMLSPNILPSDEVSIASPGGMAFVAFGEMAADGSYSGNVTVAMDVTQANIHTVEQQYGPTFVPWEITVFYLPSIAPKGADAGLGTRALAAYAADHPVSDLRSADARLDISGVFQSTEDALYQAMKG